jgi:hypothetical protein
MATIETDTIECHSGKWIPSKDQVSTTWEPRDVPVGSDWIITFTSPEPFLPRHWIIEEECRFDFQIIMALCGGHPQLTEGILYPAHVFTDLDLSSGKTLGRWDTWQSHQQITIGVRNLGPSPRQFRSEFSGDVVR